MIKSLLDNDLYKLTMMAAIFRYKETDQVIPVEYQFSNRRKEGKFNKTFVEALRVEINSLAELSLQSYEESFLRSNCPFLGDDFLGYLSNFRFKPEQVEVDLDPHLELTLSIKGPWVETILYEVPLMAIISELYFTMIDTDWEFDKEIQEAQVNCKAAILSEAGCKWADFGTRRRRSLRTQDCVVRGFSKEGHKGFVGTSNVHLAQRYMIKPIGTMAHEWVMGMSVLEGLRHANRHALRAWNKAFNGRLGIALTDTYTSDAFFNDFDHSLARLFDGVRHDSGDPIEFANKTIDHYKKLGIDPTTRTIVFSDGLTAEKAVEIEKAIHGAIRTSYGIGTHFTNDFKDSKPLNMVIKLWSCNGTPVVKLSDVPGKIMGEQDARDVAQWTFSGKRLPRNEQKK